MNGTETKEDATMTKRYHYILRAQLDETGALEEIETFSSRQDSLDAAVLWLTEGDAVRVVVERDDGVRPLVKVFEA
jgi:hypothetical protein